MELVGPEPCFRHRVSREGRGRVSSGVFPWTNPLVVIYRGFRDFFLCAREIDDFFAGTPSKIAVLG